MITIMKQIKARLVPHYHLRNYCSRGYQYRRPLPTLYIFAVIEKTLSHCCKMSVAYFIGVDVGTGSARAALVTHDGRIIKSAVHEIETWNLQPDFYEQSSENIWQACVACIKNITRGINPDDVKGLGFDATCSLVVLDKSGKPLSVNPGGDDRQNVILWLDHRAAAEAAQINELKHSVLEYVGGKISLEMEAPKLLWLKKNLRARWDKAGLFFDLPDFLTWKATGSESRSLCSLVCKWTYEISGTQQGWNGSFFCDIGLGDLQENNWRKIGSSVLAPGTSITNGLSESAANELGLKRGTPVGASIIDAHAGGLGLVGCRAPKIDSAFSSRLSLICGTSTCHMAVSESPVFVLGVWGPYFSAMVPGMWLNEGGQSATGKLIDHVIDSHPATHEIRAKLGKIHIQTYLSNLLKDLADKQNLKNVAFLTEELHVWPDFHGNRSPLADPSLKGMISGLTLAEDEQSLAVLYLSTVQALAYGTRHLLESLTQSGYKSIKSILICGGLSKNLLFTQTQADVVNLPVVSPEEPESVLLGSAILGACAAGYFADMTMAIQSMGGEGKVITPNQDVVDYHDRKYKVFLQMYAHQMEYKNIMSV